MRLCVVIIFMCVNLFLFGDTIEVPLQISAEEVQIGQKLSVTFSFAKEAEYTVLKEIITAASPLEIIDMNLHDEDRLVQVNFTVIVFEAGFFENLYIQLPVSYVNGIVHEYRTQLFSLKILDLLTEDEKNALLKTDKPESVELKPVKDIFKFRYYINGILVIVLIIIAVALILFGLYFLVIKKIKIKKRSADGQMITDPLQKFLYDIETLNPVCVNREEMEYKISQLSEIFKEFVCNVLKFNAVSETTREFAASLRQTRLDHGVIRRCSDLLNQLDMVKFARAYSDDKAFTLFKDSIRELGLEINSYYKIDETENKDTLNGSSR